MARLGWIILLLAGCATIVGAKVVWNSLRDSEDDPRDVFSFSLGEARDADILIAPLDVAPSAGGTSSSFSVSEAWIEKSAVHRYSMLWLHRRVPTGGYTIVVRLARRIEPRFALWPPDRVASFTWINGQYFVRYFDRMPEFPMTLVGGIKDLEPIVTLKRPNQSPEPTVMSVTPRADARVAPATTVAHL